VSGTGSGGDPRILRIDFADPADDHDLDEIC
jgi:hypothetical protein